MFLKKWFFIGVVVMITLLTVTLIAAGGAIGGSGGDSVNFNLLPQEEDPTWVAFLPWIGYENVEGLEAAEKCADEKLIATAEHVACLVEADIIAETAEEHALMIAACDEARDVSHAEAEAIAAAKGVACSQDRTKQTYYHALKRNNIPPVARVEFPDYQPFGNPVGHITISAESSSDEDGLIEHYVFRLEDADTGEVLAGPVDSRRGHVRFTLQSLALSDATETLRAVVIVEDDTQATHTAEAEVQAPAASCAQNSLFTCWLQSDDSVICGFNNNGDHPTSFQADQMMTTAQACNPAIDESTKMAIVAVGASGAKGGNSWPYTGGDGGAGGAARIGTDMTLIGPLADMCFGLGQNPGNSGVHGGPGGASTILRYCNPSNQTDTEGVWLIAGGGGGGGPAGWDNGIIGKDGGIAYSDEVDSCPPSCDEGSTHQGHGPIEGGGSGVGATTFDCSHSEANGHNGPGGAGGGAHWGTAYWTTGNPLVAGNTGQGGADKCSSGAGGGGYGGGASYQSRHGGSGGGSYAGRSSWMVSEVADHFSGAGDGSMWFGFFPGY